MSEKIRKFLNKYTSTYISLVNDQLISKNKITKFYNLCGHIKKNKKKIIIAGNGGSAAIASHFSVDMTKNAGIRCINFNESDLLTCFSNDYGYDHWVEKSLQFYADAGDLIIIISSSGKSKNMINAVKFAKKKGHKVVTLTGFKKKNQVSKLGDLNFNINSKNYNQIENLHQFILLTMVDLMIYMK